MDTTFAGLTLPLPVGYDPAEFGGGCFMPEISRFFGIVIAVFYNEHNPPHFHARYGEYKAAIDIQSLRILEGWLPPRALGLVVEWAAQHQDELMQDWELAVHERPPVQIEPLR